MTRTLTQSLPAVLLALLTLLGCLAMTATASRADLLAQATPPPPPNAPKGDQPPMVEQVAEWYVSPLGKALGPFTLDELTKLYVEREIDGKTPVWRDGMSDWMLLGNVSELAQVVASVAPKKDGPVPPPSKNTQELLDQAMLDFLIGTWRFEGYINQGGYRYYLVVELTYRTDGTYAGTETIQLPSQGGPVPPFINARLGTFEVTAIDEKNMVLTLHERSAESVKTSLTIINQTTVENSADRSKRSFRIR